MKQCHNKYYTLEDGTAVLFDRHKFESAILAKKNMHEKNGKKCSKQTIMELIAEEICVSVSTVKHWRAGHHAPSDLEKIKDVACALGTEMNSLLEKVCDCRKDKHLMNFDLIDKNELEDIWNDVMKILSKELTGTAIATWFNDCKAVSISENNIVLSSPTSFKAHVIKSRYQDNIKTALAVLLNWEGVIEVISECWSRDYV